jgi:hypothetical protein
MGNRATHSATKPVPTAQQVFWGAVALALSNLATILKQLKDILESANQIWTFVSERVPFWVLASLIGVGLIVGNVYLFRFIFAKLSKRILQGRKLLAASAAGLVTTILLIMNLSSMADLRAGSSVARERLLAEITGAQENGRVGGFRIYPNKQQARQDSWTTAQALTAILAISDQPDVERLKNAFNYLETMHLPGGWIADPDDSNKFGRTEISCWVAIAYFTSLRRNDFWTHEEANDVSKRATSITEQIVTLQDKNGGWAPTAEPSYNNDRTYPTIMALWAISEALLSKEIPKEHKILFGQSLDRGISWLLDQYKLGYGWDENPANQGGSRYDGLNYEALLILKHAEDLEGHSSFKGLEQYKRIKRDVVHLFPAPVLVSSKTAVPTSDLNVGGKICWATFPSYPWSLAALIELTNDKDISSSDRRQLSRVLDQELRELSDLPMYLRPAETWEIAENLIGLSYVVRWRNKR